jgi:hypothetical protein
MVDIVQIQNRMNKDAIELLEEAIIEIKSGEILEIAIAFVKPGVVIGYGASGGNESILLGAALSYADRNFNKDHVDNQ